MRGPISRGRARYIGLVAAAGLLATTAMSTGPATAAPISASTAKSQAATAAYSAGRYIVTFVDEPAASYDGYRKGFAATRPAAGKKLNPNSAAVKAWRGHLTAGHNAALAKVGATKLYDYTVTNNAVAAQLSAKQATRLAKTAGVVSLEKDQLRTARHDRLPRLPRAQPARRPLVAARRQHEGRRGNSGRHRRLRHLARERGLRRRNRHPGPRAVVRQLPGRCELRHLDLQRQARGCPLLRRRLQQAQHREGGVPLPA